MPRSARRRSVTSWTIDSSGRGGVFCSALEPEVSSFRTITFEGRYYFEGELICGGRSLGLGADAEQGATFPEVVSGNWRVEGGAVLLGGLFGDGEPVSYAVESWASDNPQPVEVDGDEMFAGALDEDRTRYERS